MKRAFYWLATLLLSANIYLATTAEAKDCIGVVSAGRDAFWTAVQAGAEQAGKELGVEIYSRGPANEADINAQAYIVDTIVRMHCKALVLAPNTPERTKQVAALKVQGIPTVYIDRDTGGAEVVGVVETNNFKAGLLAGQEMGKALDGKGRILLKNTSSTTASLG